VIADTVAVKSVLFKGLVASRDTALDLEVWLAVGAF
jgi:hypothetical protein